MGSICRSFTQELAPKVWFWFAKLILKIFGPFFGEGLPPQQALLLHRFDRNVIKPSCLVYNFPYQKRTDLLGLLFNIVLKKYFIGKP